MQRYCRNISDLPAEVAEHAISYVPPKDLCSVVLASSKMRTLASNPKLWTQMKVKEAKIQQNGLTELFSIKRFSKVRKLDLNFPQMTNEELVRNINAIKSSSVEELFLGQMDLQETPSDMLALNKNLRSLTLYFCDITSDQFNALLVEMCSSESSLVQLELSNVTMNDDNVPVELLGRAIGSLQKVIFNDVDLTIEQRVVVMEACIASTQLVELSLGIDLFGVPSQLLGRAAGHLNKLILGGIFGGRYLATEQCNAILEACVVSPTLVDLTIKWTDLGEVTIELLKKAAGHLRSLSLDGCIVNTEQLTAVLETCIASPTLVDLTVNWADLEEVTVELVKKAAGHLHCLYLEGCNVNTEQLVAVLETCIAVPTLVELSLASLDLRAVPVDLFERAAGHLSKMILDFSDFTDEQEILIDTFDLTKIKITE